MHDKFKKRFQAPRATDRVRRQIAVEAARRMNAMIGPDPGDPLGRIRDATEADYYTAKRKAAAVLGHKIRPGDLPSDAEVREQLVTLSRSRPESGSPGAQEQPEPESDEPPALMSEHLDRYAVYRLRLAPLEGVKQSPVFHPEGDALYHSLQVFERAREVRPYDEEFLLAALLHDVGKAIDHSNHAAAGAAALRGAVTERTLWLVEHHMILLGLGEKGLGGLPARARKAVEGSEYLEDLILLREVDDAGRVPGAVVGTVEEALDFLKGLEEESYLDGTDAT